MSSKERHNWANLSIFHLIDASRGHGRRQKLIFYYPKLESKRRGEFNLFRNVVGDMTDFFWHIIRLSTDNWLLCISYLSFMSPADTFHRSAMWRWCFHYWCENIFRDSTRDKTLKPVILHLHLDLMWLIKAVSFHLTNYLTLTVFNLQAWCI